MEDSILDGLMSAPDDYDDGDEECSSDLLAASKSSAPRPRVPHAASSSALDAAAAAEAIDTAAEGAADLSTSMPTLAHQAPASATNVSSSSSSSSSCGGGGGDSGLLGDDALNGFSTLPRQEPSAAAGLTGSFGQPCAGAADLDGGDMVTQLSGCFEYQPQLQPQLLQPQQPVFGFPDLQGPSASGSGSSPAQRAGRPVAERSPSPPPALPACHRSAPSLSSSPSASLLSSSLQRAFLRQRTDAQASQGDASPCSPSHAPHHPSSPPQPCTLWPPAEEGRATTQGTGQAHPPGTQQQPPQLQPQLQQLQQHPQPTQLQPQQQCGQYQAQQPQQQQQRERQAQDELLDRELVALEEELHDDGMMMSASSLSAPGMRASLELAVQQDEVAAVQGAMPEEALRLLQQQRQQAGAAREAPSPSPACSSTPVAVSAAASPLRASPDAGPAAQPLDAVSTPFRAPRAAIATAQSAHSRSSNRGGIGPPLGVSEIELEEPGSSSAPFRSPASTNLQPSPSPSPAPIPIQSAAGMPCASPFTPAALDVEDMEDAEGMAR